MEKYRMRILDENGNELAHYDTERGYVKNETLEHPIIRKELVRGEDGKVVLDENGEPTFTEVQDGTRTEYILRYVPYSEKELTKMASGKRIRELKANLTKTDYQAIKFAEGELTAEEYAPMKEQRKLWRAEINKLESI